MPQRPPELDEAAQARVDPRHPYQVVAGALALRIEAGSPGPGAPAPAAGELAVEYGVSLATAKRALVLLQEWGQVVRRERNALVVAALPASRVEPTQLRPPPSVAANADGAGNAGSLLSFVLRRQGATLARFSSVADPTNPAELQECSSTPLSEPAVATLPSTN